MAILKDMDFEKAGSQTGSKKQNKEHLFFGKVAEDGVTTESTFASRAEGGQTLNTEAKDLFEAKENNPFAHDALHTIVQSKLASLGVEATRVTGLENEIMINAMVRVSDKLNKKFGGTSLGSVRELLVGVIKETFPDANTNPDKYEAYAGELFQLFMQSAQLSKHVLTHEGDSFREYLDLTQESLQDKEEVYAAGEETIVRAGFAADPTLQKKYAQEVNQINATLSKLKQIKATQGIDN